MSSASEGTPLLGLGGLGLAVDEAAVTTQLASEWGWNMTLGAITFIGGIFALMSPVTATVIVVTFISCALIVIGTFTLFGVCFAEPPYRLPSLFLGGIQLALGICMSTHLVRLWKAQFTAPFRFALILCCFTLFRWKAWSF